MGHDLRHACRVLFRRRGFSAAAILLPAGVGETAANFRAVSAFLLEPLPQPDRFVQAWQLGPRHNPMQALPLHERMLVAVRPARLLSGAVGFVLPVALTTVADLTRLAPISTRRLVPALRISRVDPAGALCCGN